LVLTAWCAPLPRYHGAPWHHRKFTGGNMAFQNITVEKQSGIGRLTINRPAAANVMNYETLVEMNAALDDLAKDESVRVVLLRGTGNRAFSAGVEVKDHIGARMPLTITEFGKVFQGLRNLGKPSIAVVNGVALGGGCEVVAGCDMAISSDLAKFGQPEIKLGGLAPVAAALFPRIMGERKAFEMIMLGDNITAADAERCGLVNRVVPDAELDKAADALAGKFLEKSGIGVRLCREALYQAADSPRWEHAMQKAVDLGIKTWETADAAEGLNAFLEKRAAVWKNK
jgi:enoyl-CoA hydratase